MANGAPRRRGPQAATLPVVIDTSDEGRKWAEVRAGLRCAGCEERIVQGFEFVSLVPVKDPATLQRAVRRSTTVACARPECDYAIRCARDATAVRRINKEWLFMDDARVTALFQAAAGGDC